MRALPLLALLLLLVASPLLSVMVFSPAPARAGTPPVHVYPINNYVEGNWTSYVPVWVLNSTVPWSYAYNVFVSTSGLVIVQAGANGLYRVGLSGAITQLSSGWSYPPDTIPISDSSAYGTYVITEVTWSSLPEILVMKNGSLLQTLTVAEGISGYTVMDISADGQFIVFVGNPYIELFQAVGTPASPAYSASNPLPGPGVCLSNCGAVQTSTTGQQVAYTSAQTSSTCPSSGCPLIPTAASNDNNVIYAGLALTALVILGSAYVYSQRKAGGKGRRPLI